MNYTLSRRSESNLVGVHADLVQVVRRAIKLTPVDFVVTEGRRSLERQAALVKAGASQTMDSRHLTGHAVDLAPFIDGMVRWDWPAFYPIIEAMRIAARELSVPVVHGADWKNFPDGPHHELSRDRYP